MQTMLELEELGFSSLEEYLRSPQLKSEGGFGTELECDGAGGVHLSLSRAKAALEYHYLLLSPARGKGETLLLRGTLDESGVLLIVLFFVFREQKEALLLTVPPLLLVFYTPMELWGTLALLPIALYDPQKGRTDRRASPQQPKSRRGRALQWFFYLYYPAHLTVLALLRDLLLHTPVTLELPF